MLFDRARAAGMWKAAGYVVVLFIAGTLVRTAQLPAEQPQFGWIDASLRVDPATVPVYPGDAAPSFTFLKSMALGDKLNLSELRLGAHTGTHIDAPLHFIAEGAAVDQIPLEKLIGPALVIACSPSAALIDVSELNQHHWKGEKRVLFKTRNSYQNLWSDRNFHKDFTAIAPDAARLLAEAGVHLVGIDYLSVEKFGSPEPLAHLALLRKGVVIVEGLDLRQVEPGEYDAIVLPIKLAGREAAPTRVLLRRKSSF